jgi:hypothetical protein
MAALKVGACMHTLGSDGACDIAYLSPAIEHPHPYNHLRTQSLLTRGLLIALAFKFEANTYKSHNGSRDTNTNAEPISQP